MHQCAKEYRNSHVEVFCKKDVFRKFAKFTGKHLYWSFFLNKVALLRKQQVFNKFRRKNLVTESSPSKMIGQKPTILLDFNCLSQGLLKTLSQTFQNCYAEAVARRCSNEDVLKNSVKFTGKHKQDWSLQLY